MDSKFQCLRIYGDEDSSDSEGLELADGTKVGKKTTGGAGGSGGGKPRKKPAASSSASTSGSRGSARSGGSASTSGGSGTGTGGGSSIGGPRGDDPGRGKSEVGTTTVMMMMTLTNAGRQGEKVDHQDRPWPIKNHAKWAQFTPR